ncbi:ATP-binding protein [Pseudanabaena sp. UWO311]|uniref:ATP-binding protein n=1 Tax=Pseudanabaena sp. UWO311 TaxID=2487337 RepID=UPI001CC2089D|nr:ATP-binding protein [Pseudanabaena sp. UWO311]
MKGLSSFPISLRISIPTILIFCGGLLGLTSFNQEINQAYQKTEINTKNYVQISAGQTSRILDYLYRRANIEEAEITIISQLGSDPNLNLVMLIDDLNVVHLSNLYELKNEPIAKTRGAEYVEKFGAVRKNLSGDVLISADRSKLIAMYPVILPVQPDEIQSSRVGVLFFEYDLTRTKQIAFNDALKRSLFFSSSLVIFCLGVWFFFEITLTRRVSRLVAVSNSLAEGKLDERAGLTGSDELFQISVAFDRMAGKIQDNANTLLRQNAVLQAQIEASIDGISIVDENRSIVSYNQRICDLWQIPVNIIETGDDREFMKWLLSNLVEPEIFCAKIEHLYENPHSSSVDEVVLKDGHIFDCYSTSVKSLAGDFYYGRIWYFRDITDRRKAEKLIQQQAEGERLLREITQRIRQSLDLVTIFNTATEEIRQFLNADRVGVLRFEPKSNNTQGEFVSESLIDGVTSIVAISIDEHCFGEKHTIYYQKGRIQSLDDINQANIKGCYRELLESFQIRANLVVPLLNGEDLWGLLCIHQCHEPRAWHQSEIEFVQQIANQLAIAIQQANLFQQIQKELAERQQAESRLTESNQQLAITNQELARATRLKDEFLANMSHELRTPLNAILGMSEALQEQVFGTINEEQKESLETIASSGKHLLELINDILDVAKIESGQVEIDCSQTSINELCQSSLPFVKQQALRKRIHLELKIAPNLPELFIDERRIRQALINLLSNAIKFTPERGRVSLAVSLQQNPAKITNEVTSEITSEIRFAVTDTGIGISPENLQKLFQPFVQIDGALNRQNSGTGLGLALVKSIVKMHKGTVSVTSEVGVGSCFTIALPCENISIPLPIFTNQPTNPLEPSPDNGIAEGLPTLLLAEDNEANKLTISRYLKARGYQLLFAKDGREAIDLARSMQPDLILMDIQMPRIDGLEAIKIIRGSNIPELANIPIIALTALVMTGDRDRCIEAGANEYLTKPVKLNHLATTIKQILAQKQ